MVQQGFLSNGHRGKSTIDFDESHVAMRKATRLSALRVAYSSDRQYGGLCHSETPNVLVANVLFIYRSTDVRI